MFVHERLSHAHDDLRPVPLAWEHGLLVSFDNAQMGPRPAHLHTI